MEEISWLNKHFRSFSRLCICLSAHQGRVLRVENYPHRFATVYKEMAGLVLEWRGLKPASMRSSSWWNAGRGAKAISFQIFICDEYFRRWPSEDRRRGSNTREKLLENIELTSSIHEIAREPAKKLCLRKTKNRLIFDWADAVSSICFVYDFFAGHWRECKNKH